MNNEEEHFNEVLFSLCLYKKMCLMTVDKYIDDFNSLSISRKDLLPEYEKRLKDMENLISRNQNFLSEIISLHKFPSFLPQTKPSALIFENIKSLFRQIVRDWSTIGESERHICYGEILSQIKVLFPLSDGIRVLVPGAGLGRLVFELARIGFHVEGNEFSLLILFASEVILNVSHLNKWNIHPFIFPFSNVIRQEDQFKEVFFPDVQVGQTKGEMSMVAGDFIEVYSKDEEQNSWDCVVTCFFIDTGPNIFDYIDIIYGILKKDGYWINLGPLLYHYEGNDSSMSIEVTLEELLLYMERKGLEVIHRKDKLSCPYVQNPTSILQTRYECSLLVIRKK
jgi:carnosine N-methyltransferase